MQPAQFGNAFAQNNVRAASRHVCRYSHLARLPGLSDNLCFLFVKLRIQDIVGNSMTLQLCRQFFRLCNRRCPDKNRLSLGVKFLNLINGSPIFGAPGLVDDIREILPNHRTVRRNHNHVKSVNLPEFLFFRLGCSGHACQLFVHPKIVLESNGRQRLALALDLHAFLGFNGLMQSIRVAASEHQTAGELVHNNHFAVFNDIVLVPLHQGMRPKCLVEMMRQFHIVVIVEVANIQGFFGFGDPCLGRRHSVKFLIDGIVIACFKLGHNFRQHIIKIGRFFARPGNNQRCSRLVNQNGIDLVNNGIVHRPLHHLIGMNHHIVAQIVESKLVIGSVGHISGIGRAAFCKIKAVNNQPD